MVGARQHGEALEPAYGLASVLSRPLLAMETSWGCGQAVGGQGYGYGRRFYPTVLPLPE